MGGRLFLASVAGLALSACVPRAPVAASDVPTLPAEAATTARETPRFALDLSKVDDRPAWEMRPVVARAVTEGGRRYHVVAAGETGIAVARAYSVPWSAMVEANALAPPYVLRVGQRLLLPSGGSDAPSPEARARAFRVDIDDLVTGSEPARIAQTPRPAVTAVPTVPTVSTSAFVWPATGPLAARFGPQGSGRVNQGIDITTPAGANVRATAPGTVAYVGKGVPGYGGLILVRHDGNWISAYGRVGTTLVAKGDTVRAGQPIGTASGDAPLHFELRRARVPVDPLGYLPRR